MTLQMRTIALTFILLFGFCARAATYRSPLLDHHAWRQADTAAMARNFARERLNPFYPQVDWRGARADGSVETGLELFAFTVAVVAPVTGFHTEVGRLLATLLFIASGLLVHGFARHRYGDVVGLVATFVYAFGFPLALFFDRAFMNEPLLICLCLASLRATQVYLNGQSPTAYAVLVVSTVLIGMIKLPYLIVWAPIAGLFAEHDAWRTVRRADLHAVFAADLAAAGLWYWHAHQLGVSTGLTFGITDKLFDASLVFSSAFPVQLSRQLFKDLFGVSLVFFLIGAVLVGRQRRWFETFGVAGFVAYLIIVARGNYVHDYYQLPVMMMAPFLTALGVVEVASLLSARVPRWRDREPALLAACLVLITISTFLRSVSAHSWYEVNPDFVQACRQSAEWLEPDDRLLFVDYNDPQLLFCMDRHGWLFPPALSDDSYLTEAWREGATVAVVVGGAGPHGVGWAAAHGTLIFSNPTLAVYRLEKNGAGPE